MHLLITWILQRIPELPSYSGMGAMHLCTARVLNDITQSLGNIACKNHRDYCPGVTRQPCPPSACLLVMWPAADARAFSRPTSKAREKRPGDEAGDWVLVCSVLRRHDYKIPWFRIGFAVILVWSGIRLCDCIIARGRKYYSILNVLADTDEIHSCYVAIFNTIRGRYPFLFDLLKLFLIMKIPCRSAWKRSEVSSLKKID